MLVIKMSAQGRAGRDSPMPQSRQIEGESPEFHVHSEQSPVGNAAGAKIARRRLADVLRIFVPR